MAKTIKVRSVNKSEPTPAGTHWGGPAYHAQGYTGRYLIRDDGAHIDVYPDPGYPPATELDADALFGAVVTDAQIDALLGEAVAAGDELQADDCRDALCGDEAARRRCVIAIRSAAAADS